MLLASLLPFNKFKLSLLFTVISCSTIFALQSAGVAAFYDDDFEGKQTASGEFYSSHELTAAHATLPFGTLVELTNQTNGAKTTVRINDRNLVNQKYDIIVSKRAAYELGFIDDGITYVTMTVVSHSPPVNENVNALKSLPSNIEIVAPVQGNQIVYDNRPVLHYSVQLAAFTNKAFAERKASQIPNSWIHAVPENGKTIYRVFVGRFNSLQEANKQSATLKSKGMDCFVITLSQ